MPHKTALPSVAMLRATSAQLPLARYAGLVLVGYLTVGDEGLALGMKASPRDAPYRVDVRVGASRTQLCPNVCDVGIGGLVSAVGSVVVGGVGDFTAGEHASRVPGEQLQNLELCSGQLYGGAIDEELP